jgi:hypothetical protein
MEKQQGRLAPVTYGVDEMNALTFDVSRKLRKAVEAALHSAPIEPLGPVAD